MTIIEAIILGIVALAFVFLIIFLVILIIHAIKTLKKVNSILDSLGNEPTEIVQNIHGLSDNILNKMKCLDPLFESIANIGEGLEYKTYSFKERSHWKCYKDKIHETDEGIGSDKVSKIMDYVLLSINLWKNLKKK